MKYDEFNEWYEIGTPVIYTDDFGKEHQTVTRSKSWDLCGTSVVCIKGKNGGFDLDRIRVVEHHKM